MSEFDFNASTISTRDVGDKSTNTTVNSTQTTTVNWQAAAQIGLTQEEWEKIKDKMSELITAHEKQDKERMVEAGYEMVSTLGKKAVGAMFSYFTGL